MLLDDRGRRCRTKTEALAGSFVSHKRRAPVPPVPSRFRKKEADSDSSVDSDTSDEATATQAYAVCQQMTCKEAAAKKERRAQKVKNSAYGVFLGY